MSEINITKENFEAEVMNSDKTVLVDFWATWCGPCRMIAPIIEEIANEKPDIKVCKVNVDEQPQLAIRFNIASIPTLLVIKNGVVTNSALGFMPKEKVLELLK